MYGISVGELKSDFDKAWQYSQNEPVFISEQGQNRRVLLSFDEFTKLTKPKTSNADRLGMSLADLAKSGEIEFERLNDLPREIEL